MKRDAWLKEMRMKTKALYDHFAPLYWDRFGTSISEVHARFLIKFLGHLPLRSRILSAGCGAGLYDGLLLEAGHDVVGIDLSEGMIARAKERFPEVEYQVMGMQEMDFQEKFHGAVFRVDNGQIYIQMKKMTQMPE